MGDDRIDLCRRSLPTPGENELQAFLREILERSLLSARQLPGPVQQIVRDIDRRLHTSNLGNTTIPVNVVTRIAPSFRRPGLFDASLDALAGSVQLSFDPVDEACRHRHACGHVNLDNKPACR